MKDGIYRVTLTIDGLPVVAEAQVRNGVFQGLGGLAGIVGVFATEAGNAAGPASVALPDRGKCDHVEWERTDVAPAPLAVDATDLTTEARFAELANDLYLGRETIETLRNKSGSTAASAGRAPGDTPTPCASETDDPADAGR